MSNENRPATPGKYLQETGAAPTAMNDTPKLKPRLRFPEFRAAGDWEMKEVGEVFKVTRGEVLSMKLVRDVKTDEMPYPVYSSQTKNNGLSGYYSDYLFEDAITWTTDGANAGDVNFRVGKFYCTNVCGVLLNTKGFANPCTAALINSVARNYVSYVGNPKLMNGVMSKISIPFPSVAEQQKIAACLSTLDATIAAHARQLAALGRHKKALMQQLFPREGETQPRLRFPEFRAAGDWEIKPMREVYTFKGNNSLSREKLNYVSGSVKNIHYGDIHTKFSTHFDITKEVVPYINQDEPLNSLRPEYSCAEKDIIFADASEDLQDVGKSIEIINLNNERVVSGLHTILARQIKDDFVIGFGGHLFKSKMVRAQIQKESQGAKVLGISATRLANINLSFPSHKAEQQKIAACLSTLDACIAAQAQKLAALQQHKRGLMQGLFPYPMEDEA
jgi:type I restriction enzyme S subunit